MTLSLPSPAHPRTLPEIRASLTAQRDELLLSVPAEGRPAPLEGAGIALGRRNARILDELLGTLFTALRSGDLEETAVAVLERRIRFGPRRTRVSHAN